MQDSAVMSGLMAARATFLFEKQQRDCGITAQELTSGREPDDSSSDDGNF